MRENREKIMPFIFEDEGGYALRENLGQSNKGIELHTFYSYRKKHGLPIPVYADLKNISIEEATAIYGEQFFDPIRFDELKSGVDYVVADTAINLGVTGASLLLRTTFDDLPQNRTFDDELVHFLNNLDTKTVINEIRDSWLHLKKFQYEQRKAADPNYPDRRPGWINRDQRVRERAFALAGLTPSDP